MPISIMFISIMFFPPTLQLDEKRIFLFSFSCSFHPPFNSMKREFFFFFQSHSQLSFRYSICQYKVTAELTFENEYQDDRRTRRAHLRHVFPARYSLHASSRSRGACDWTNVLSLHHQHHHWRSARESRWLCTLQPPKGAISKKSARYALYWIHSIDSMCCIIHRYRVAQTHRIPYLYRSFSAQEIYI